MSMLLAVYDRNKCLGRCDATCYNGTGTQCRCICCGFNHGVGRARAIANTRRSWDHWLTCYFGRDWQDRDLRVIRGLAVRQRDLFTDALEDATP